MSAAVTADVRSPQVNGSMEDSGFQEATGHSDYSGVDSVPDEAPRSAPPGDLSGTNSVEYTQDFEVRRAKWWPPRCCLPRHSCIVH